MNTKIKVFRLILWCLLVVGIAVLAFSYFNNVYYSQQLISAIEQDDAKRVRELTDSKFGNVDSLPVVSKHLALLAERQYPTPLQAACRKGNFEIVKLLIDKGADVNYVVSGMDTRSPLMLAAYYNERDSKLEIIKLLVENDANIDYVTRGQTAMTCLAETNHPQTIESIEYLESKGQNVYGENYSDGTLLHYACRAGNSLVINYLVTERNVDVNAINSDGRTPLICLMFPVAPKSIDDLMLLLEYGADTTIVDNDGYTAYDYAIKYEKTEFAELLKPE